MPNQIGSCTTQVAKKQHKCNFCGQFINVGDQYERSRLVYDGNAYTWKNHIHCIEIARHFNMFDDCSDEGLTGEYFIESLYEIYKADHPEEKWPINIKKMVRYCLEIINPKSEIDHA